jgi:hypothetical protein
MSPSSVRESYIQQILLLARDVVATKLSLPPITALAAEMEAYDRWHRAKHGDIDIALGCDTSQAIDDIVRGLSA